MYAPAKPSSNIALASGVNVPEIHGGSAGASSSSTEIGVSVSLRSPATIASNVVSIAGPS